MFRHLSPFKTHLHSWKTGAKANKAAKLKPEQTKSEQQVLLSHPEPPGAGRGSAGGNRSGLKKPIRGTIQRWPGWLKMTLNRRKWPQSLDLMFCAVLCAALCVTLTPVTTNNNNGGALPCWISSFWACWHGQPSERSVDLRIQSGSVTRTCLHAAERGTRWDSLDFWEC